MGFVAPQVIIVEINIKTLTSGYILNVFGPSSLILSNSFSIAEKIIIQLL